MISGRLVLCLLVVINVHLGTCYQTRPPLGRSMRSEFYIDDNYVQLNSGSFGCPPKFVIKALQEYRERSERNPDLWLRRDAETETFKVQKMLADLVNADSEDVVMVPNATSGLNSVLRSILFALGERIFHFSTVYSSVRSIIQFVVDSSNGAVSSLEMNITYPMSNEDLLQQLNSFLDKTHDPKNPIRIAVVDHVSSVPAVVNPLDKIIPMLKKRNITVLIDGAQALGQVPINITALTPDFYVASCNKWLQAARGCALLYADKKHQGYIHPTTIAFRYRQPSDYQNEFFVPGTVDYSPYMTVPAALQFRREAGGEEAIMQYNHNLALRGGKLMAKRFNTRVLQEENQMGSMVDIQLPVKNPDDARLNGNWWVDQQLYGKHNYTFSNVYKHNGVWWARISTQMFNDITDFEMSARHFQGICDELNSSQK